MNNRRCPECSKRLPYAAHWCRACGWSRDLASGALAGTRAVARRALRAMMVVLTCIVVAALGRAVIGSETIADWYAEFAFQRLPSMFSGWAPSESYRGAYLYCVKRAARELQSSDAVTTFPSLGESELTRLSERRYRVRSFVDQHFESGAEVRRAFRCLVRYERGRWALEELNVEPGVRAAGAALR